MSRRECILTLLALPLVAVLTMGQQDCGDSRAPVTIQETVQGIADLLQRIAHIPPGVVPPPGWLEPADSAQVYGAEVRGRGFAPTAADRPNLGGQNPAPIVEVFRLPPATGVGLPERLAETTVGQDRSWQVMIPLHAGENILGARARIGDQASAFSIIRVISLAGPPAPPAPTPQPPFGRFVFPVLGNGVTDPLANTTDPRQLGWYVNNFFGNRCEVCGTRSQPYHPGEDFNRVGGDADSPVFAVHDGQVIRVRRLSDSLGWAVIVRHDLPRDLDITPFILSGTTLPQGRQRTRTISSAYLHLHHVPSSVREGARVQTGDRVGTIYPNTSGGPHLHFEIRANGDHRTAANSVGYYATWQEITDFGYVSPTKVLKYLLTGTLP